MVSSMVAALASLVMVVSNEGMMVRALAETARNRTAASRNEVRQTGLGFVALMSATLRCWIMNRQEEQPLFEGLMRLNGARGGTERFSGPSGAGE